MGMSFFKDFEKLNPEKPKEVTKDTQVTSMSSDDMKAYFEAMRESIINEVKSQIEEIKKGGLDNASNTDLPDSESDSAESSVDRIGGS